MDFLRGFWLLYVAASCARGDTKTRSCTEVRQVYGAKGFSLSGVPQAEISGEHLRICPQGYTCCTSEMEENFANKSKSEFEGMLKDNSRSIQVILTIQFKNFDGYFQDLLNKSEKSLHDTFPTMYGELYSQNVKLFRDLYTELRRYYRGSNINLEEALTEFWTRLLERLFKLLNPQYLITDDYLDCMGKHSEQHKPFGEVPRELKLKATRAFIAVRSFVQGLSVGGDVVKKVSQVSFGQECSRAIMKLVYCSHCLGMPSILPCNNYCRNVMKGCLANQADLDTEWRNLIDSMLLVADKIDIPSNVETVIGNIHTKISEAISTMQENKDAITTKVFQGCGNPKINSKGSSGEEKKRRGKSVTEEKPSGVGLEKLISDAKGKLKDIKDFWVVLPSLLCNEKVAVGSVNNDKCWNGMTRGRYLPEVMGDGLANQINNPEVEVDITKPDMTIRQQIMQLKIMTNRLRNAYNGNDVDFQDTSDDISGSGSGEGCLDEMCVRKTNRSPSTRQPETHAIPNQSDRNTNGASSHFLPSSFLLFLSLAIVATRYLWR
ncbi:glypican-1 [Ornithorhynchus anatinus]|uniref:Glypican-1 n=1 Tax=Ornithorhynchus anatinus TaxID=9258 RepID=F7EAR5_ORNAN|nr:glypican-1 [Ornithorhynchus anatinus]